MAEMTRRLREARLLEVRIDRCLLAFAGVRLSDYLVLDTLAARRGRARIGALADAVGMSKSCASHLVGRVEGRGLVTCCAAVVDGRGIEVRLTDQGARLRETATEVYGRLALGPETVVEVGGPMLRHVA
ncbi:hypothetical protein GCM10009634_74570 [Saccharothrix xinjiangensis]